MKKKPTAKRHAQLHVQLRRTITIGSVLLGIFLFVIVLLLARTQSLSLRLSELEMKNAKMALEATAYKRAYCTNSFSAIKANTTTGYHMQSAGYARTYRVHTPKDYDPTVRYPVVFSFDGVGGSGSRIESYSGIDSLPVIAVYPDALRGRQGFTAWQGAPYSLKGDYDIQFVRDLLEAIPSNYCTDSTKVFAVGMSNGGGFVALAGCRLPDKFRAVASVSGAYYTSCGETAQSPSLLIVHSESDRQVPFDGSSKRGLPAITQWAKREARERLCKDVVQSQTESGDTAVKPNTLTVFDWQECQHNSLLRLVVVQDQNHGWLQIPEAPIGGTSGTSGYIWEFFQTVAMR